MNITALQKSKKFWLWMAIGSMIIVSSALIVINANYKMMYAVYIDEQLLGYISDKGEVNSSYNEMISTMKVGAEHLAFVEQPVLRFEEKKSWMTEDQTQDVLNQVKTQMKPLVRATQLLVNDKPIAVLTNDDTVKQAVELVKKYYFRDENIKMSTVEKVSAIDTQVKPDEVMSVEDAFDRLTRIESPATTYPVENGDTLWDVAIKFDKDFDDLMNLNPRLGDLLQAGQVVLISPEKRTLTIRSEVNEVDQVVIPYRTISKTETRSGTIQPQVGKNGAKEMSYQVILENGRTISRTLTGERIVDPPVDQIKVKKREVQIASFQGTEISNGSLLWPVNGGSITSYYGKRGKSLHKGIDIARAKSLNILASDGGKVVFAGWKGDYGNLIIISHNNGYSTYYAHNKKLLVSEGNRVQTGDSIAVMGSTGQSTGVHLHFEVRKEGKAVNPISYLKG